MLENKRKTLNKRMIFLQPPELKWWFVCVTSVLWWASERVWFSGLAGAPLGPSDGCGSICSNKKRFRRRSYETSSPRNEIRTRYLCCCFPECISGLISLLLIVFLTVTPSGRPIYRCRYKKKYQISADIFFCLADMFEAGLLFWRHWERKRLSRSPSLLQYLLPF